MATKQPTKKVLTAFVKTWLTSYEFDATYGVLTAVDVATDECIEACSDHFEVDLNEKSIEVVNQFIVKACPGEHIEATASTVKAPHVIIDNTGQTATDDQLAIEPPIKPMTASQALQLLSVIPSARAQKAVEIEHHSLDTELKPVVIELQNDVSLSNGVTLKVNPNVNINIRTGLPVKYNIVPPKQAGKCYDVWLKCGELMNQGITPTAALIDAWSNEMGYNLQNGRIELYRFLKYYGIAKVA